MKRILLVSCLLYFCSLSALEQMAFAEDGPSVDKSELKKDIFVPLVYYTPETSVALGGMWIHNLQEDAEKNISQVLSIFSYTLKSQMILIVEPKIYLSPSMEWFSRMNVQNFPTRYYGRGQVSLEEPEVYQEELGNIETGFKRRLAEDWFWSNSVAVGRRSLDAELTSAPNVFFEIEDFGSEVEFSKLRTSFSWDERDDRTAPKSGQVTEFAVDLFRITGNAVRSNTRYNFERKDYFQLSFESVIASQFLFLSNTSREMPFYFLNGLGGGRLMRGLFAQQYRDNSLAAFTVEYRKDLSGPWSVKTFAGIGAVSASPNELFEVQSKASAGFGFNYTLDERSRVALRLDLGFADSSRGFYFLYGDAF